MFAAMGVFDARRCRIFRSTDDATFGWRSSVRQVNRELRYVPWLSTVHIPHELRLAEFPKLHV